MSTSSRWSNADLLRLSHPKTTEFQRNNLYRWIVGGFLPAVEQGQRDGTKGKLPLGSLLLPEIIPAFEQAKVATSTEELVQLITDYNLSREMLPTEALTNPKVWEALLEKMPPTAMIRNLGNMSKVGLLTPLSNAAKKVSETLTNQDLLKKARIHPLSVLVALKTYASGTGVKGSGTWTPVPSVVDSLDDCFYLTFDYVEPTGKNLLIGIDCSASMTWSNVAGMPINPREAAATLAMATVRVEHNYHVMGFCTEFRDLGITSKMSLTEAIQVVDRQHAAGTDCSLPMLWAIKNQAKVDGFVVITDNETYAGRMHPSQALREYRKQSGIQSRQIVVGMTSTGFSIADPKDPLTLDMVGFDTNGPAVISEFMRG